MKPYYQDESVTLYCGDATIIAPLLGPIDMIWTDPPYGHNNSQRVFWTDEFTGVPIKSKGVSP